MIARRALFALLLTLLPFVGGCMSTYLDQPYQVRKSKVFLPPLFDLYESDDGTSMSWDALFWIVGHEREANRTHTRVFPFYWRNTDSPYSESTLILPFWYSRNSPTGNTRFWSLLYGYIEEGDVRSDYVLPPIFYMERSKTGDYNRSGIFLLYDWRSYEDGRRDFTFINFLGLIYLFKIEAGLPPAGETVGSMGRTSSRRFELLNLLGFVSLMGYDDVGDTREFRFLTLFSSEVLSLVRSWRNRGGEPFVREWVFPVYMNIQDAQSGWSYLGPFWGTRTDRLKGEHTDWWLLGLTSRRSTPEGNTWKILGLPIFTTDPDEPPDEKP